MTIADNVAALADKVAKIEADVAFIKDHPQAATVDLSPVLTAVADVRSQLDVTATPEPTQAPA